MATKRIKGITIVIDGDTTKLEKALSKLNTELKNSQSALKDVDKLLKLDPGNTELLQQKYRLLGTSVDDTKQKLETLKEAQGQMNRAMANGEDVNQEQYDALQREIVETEEKLKSLTKEYKNFGTVSAQQIAAAGEKMKTLGNNISTAGRDIMPVSTAVAGLGAASVKTAADFDSSMSKVKAISGATGDEFDKLRVKAIEMGGKTVFSASESAEAMNYMAMAGWKAEDMLNGIEGVMNLAAASGESLGTTSDIVTDALTAFGLKAQDAGHFADILAAASSNANTNVYMMGESFKYAAPLMGSMGYSAEDTALALGIMANSGIKASMAGRAVRNIITRMAKPTEESAIAMENLGLSLQDAEGNMYTFREILQQIRAGFGDLKISQEEYTAKVAELDAALEDGTISEKEYEEELEKFAEAAFGAAGALNAENAAMLAGKQGMSGLLAIVMASDEDFIKLTNAIDNCNGSAEQMAETMLDNLGGDIKLLKSALETLAISIGDALMPTIRDIVAHIQTFADWLNSLDNETKDMIIKIGLFVAALGPFLIILGKLLTAIGTIMTWAPKIASTIIAVKTAIMGVGEVISLVAGGAGTLKEAMTAVFGGVAATVAGVVSIIGGVVVAVKNFVDMWQNGWDAIKAIFMAIGVALAAVGAVILGAPAAIAAIVAAIVYVLANAVILIKEHWEEIKVFFAELWENIKEGAAKLWEEISSAASKAWETIKNIVSVAIQFIGQLLKLAFEILMIPWMFIWVNFGSYLIEAWEAIKSIVSGALEAISNVITTIWTAIKDFFGPILDAIKQVFNTVWTAIKELITTVMTAIKEHITTAWNNIKTVVNTVMNAIKQVFSTIWEAIKSVITNVINNIKTAISNGLNSAKQTISNILEAIKSKFSSIWEGVKSIVSGAIEKIKSFMNFSWELPKLKLPHFSISGEFSLNPPKVPSFGIDWYKKAMDEGMILTRPTIFGASGGNLLAGGEAGPEAVVGVSSLRAMIQDAVANVAPAGGNITIPVYIGNRRIETVVVDAITRNNYRSGGR